MNPKGTKGVVTNFAVRVDFAPVEPVDQIMLELLTEGQPKVRTPNSGKKALVVLHDVILNPPAISLGIYDGLVNTVELFEKVGQVYISIDQLVPAKPVLRWQPGLPQRLYVELSRRSVCQRLGGRRICIDPGHGGADSGAVRRQREADLVLQSGLILARWLERHGAKVSMTRREDRTCTWEERLELIKEAEIYLGLHGESVPGTAQRGTLILSGPDRQSQRLAQALHRALFLKNDYLVDLGVKPHRDLPLPKGCVGVVLELENVRNLVGEALLRDIDVQERVVQGLLHGLVEYLS
ncbi:MAG TPA: N-acetylmuramoyl-L-alanine amidase [Firmicutes bacterium]|nr:N-acetylmuramoyl-L-alanine amidase [Bacillota bacterium]